jgi:hypothetical protein
MDSPTVAERIRGHRRRLYRRRTGNHAPLHFLVLRRPTPFSSTATDRLTAFGICCVSGRMPPNWLANNRLPKFSCAFWDRPPASFADSISISPPAAVGDCHGAATQRLP